MYYKYVDVANIDNVNDISTFRSAASLHGQDGLPGHLPPRLRNRQHLSARM